ncbi:MAG: tetratricopeptide repeat protein [Peptococcaceae bacterium]
MRYFFYWYLFRLFLGNPLLALLLVAVIYLVLDRQFIGLLPDIFKPFKRRSRINTLKEEVKLNPANVNAYKELGQMYLESKRYQEAIDYFEKALSKLGDYADVHFYLGKACFLYGQQEKGIEELQQALRLNSKVGYGEPYIYLLDYYIVRGKESAGIDAYLEQVERFGTPEILYKAGDVLLKHGDQRGKGLLREALANYKAIPGNFKKMHRRWALLAKLKTMR